MGFDEHRDQIRSIVEDPSLSYRQRVHALAGAAEDVLEPPGVSESCAAAFDKGIICDLFEGNAPYRPRYTLPDYQLALIKGSDYLELPAPRTFDEATTFLLSLYANVPSITGYPVWFGNLDALLEPFAVDLSDDELYGKVKNLWVLLDRLFPDAFAHANLGPADTRVARTMLAVHREVHQVVPNLTLKVDPEITSDELLLEAASTIVSVAQPHLVNHRMMVADLTDRYGVVSCYNSLPASGGSHTLVRLNLMEVARLHEGDVDSFLTSTLPAYIELTAEFMEARIRYLVEQAQFYEHSWLVAEGLLSLDRFTAMFGIFGLAECVEHLLMVAGDDGRYGRHPHADHLAQQIVATCAQLVAERPMPYCEATGGRALLHSQGGLDSDIGVTAGTRVAVGSEPDLYRHLQAVAPNHVHFPSGVSDIVRLDETVVDNPSAVVDIAKGAFAMGMRDVTFEVANGEFVRITGYLVRRRDLERVGDPEGVRHSSTVLGAGSMTNMHLDNRVPQRVRSHERDPRPRR